LPLFIINTLFLPDEINQLYDFVSSFISAIWRSAILIFFQSLFAQLLFISQFEICLHDYFVTYVCWTCLSNCSIGAFEEIIRERNIFFAFGIHKTLYSIFHAINFNSFRFKTVKLVFISVFEEIKSSLKISSKFDKTNCKTKLVFVSVLKPKYFCVVHYLNNIFWCKILLKSEIAEMLLFQIL